MSFSFMGTALTNNTSSFIFAFALFFYLAIKNQQYVSI